jgi:uncharacterized membrane protein (Fun14 family)
LDNLFTPLVGSIGIGGIGGFLVGYALKKLMKLIAIIIGVFTITLIYLASKNIIMINYPALNEWANRLATSLGGTNISLTPVVTHLPFAGSFIAGSALGFKKG